MADRIVHIYPSEVPQLPDVLVRVFLFCIDEAKDKMVQGVDLVPFTALAVKDDIFIEMHDASTRAELFRAALRCVCRMQGACAYALCYDGYLETDGGYRDALIAEGGIAGAEKGYAVCCPYSSTSDAVVFEERLVFIGEAANFMQSLAQVSVDSPNGSEA